MVRKYTNRLLELLEEEVLTWKGVVQEMCCFLSEDKIKEFCLEGFGGELRVDGLFKELEDNS